MKAVRWPVVVVVAACVAGAPTASESQQVWGAVRLPGGAAGARRVADLGADEGRLGASVLVDLVRRYFASPISSPAVRNVERYLTFLAAVERASLAWPQGCSLPSATTPRSDRDRARDYLALLGVELREQRGAFRAVLDESDGAELHQGWLDAVGIDVGKVADDLNAGRAVRIVMPADDLPLPLPEYWTARAQKNNQAVLDEIIGDAGGAYLYHALLAMDQETLRYFGGRPALMESLAVHSGPVFATFARSIRVRGPAIELPGGSGTATVWGALVGRSPDDRDRFIVNLLGRDDGRLAFFFDAIFQLDQDLPRQRFALGAHLQGARQLSYVSQVYRHFVAVEHTWRVTLRPFSRPTFDPSLVLRLVDVFDGGVAGPSWWPSVLERAVAGDDWPVDRTRTARSIRSRPLDAAWLFSWIFASSAESRQRFELFRFAQRNFADLGMEDSASLEIALRMRRDMPALAISLERMGVRDSAVFERVAWSARRITTSAGRDDALPVVARWQAVVALLEQVQRRRRLPSNEIASLLTSFVSEFPDRVDRAPGVSARWLSRVLLTPSGTQSDPPASVDRDAMLRFAGPPPDRTRSFSWEGLSYVIDPRGPILRMLSEMPPASSLAELVTLETACSGLGQPMTTLETLRSATRELRTLEPIVSTLAGARDEGGYGRRYRSMLTDLDRINATKDLPRVARHTASCWAAVDAVSDRVVPRWLYALATAPTDLSADVLADIAGRHSLRVPTVVGAEPDWRLSAWTLAVPSPRSEAGAGFHGSLLGLDLALYSTQLRRLTSNDLLRPTQINEGDERALSHWLVLADADDLVDPAAIVRSIARGRERLGELRTGRAASPDAQRAALRAANVDEWRSNIMVWLWQHASTADDGALLLSEIAALGAPLEVRVQFPVPSMVLDGCLCARARSIGPLESFRGRDGVIPALAPDLWLRLVEQLDSLGLPAALASAVLPFALQDWLDNIHQPWADDWEAVTNWPRQLRRERLEDYLLELVSDHTLTSPMTSNSERRP